MKFRTLAAALMAALLMLALFAVPAFAETADSSANAAELPESNDADVLSAPAATATAPKEVNWDAIITGGIILLALIVLVIIYFVNKKFNEKVKKFFKDYSSELKKIVWSPLRDVKKNTVIVLVLSAFFAIVIGVLDVIFSRGIFALRAFVDLLK